MQSKNIHIIKASGQKVEFSKQKLHDSLLRSGASEAVISSVIDELEPQLFEGISTKKIFGMAFALLKRRHKPIAAKYKLKQAIMELGPSGYPFERYVSEILKHQGYSTSVGVIVQGNCVKHEIDVIAQKDAHCFIIECKYHNARGIISNVKIPLYIQSRFKDVEGKLKQMPGHEKKIHQGWVVTNTRFSDDAIQYGSCIGLNLLGWDYPKNNSLRQQIDVSGLYPITCITGLTAVEKQKLLDKNIVLAVDVFNNPELLINMGISEKRVESILRESEALCEHCLKLK